MVKIEKSGGGLYRLRQHCVVDRGFYVLCDMSITKVSKKIRIGLMVRKRNTMKEGQQGVTRCLCRDVMPLVCRDIFASVYE